MTGKKKEFQKQHEIVCLYLIYLLLSEYCSENIGGKWGKGWEMEITMSYRLSYSYMYSVG